MIDESIERASSAIDPVLKKELVEQFTRMYDSILVVAAHKMQEHTDAVYEAMRVDPVKPKSPIDRIIEAARLSQDMTGVKPDTIVASRETLLSLGLKTRPGQIIRAGDYNLRVKINRDDRGFLVYNRHFNNERA